MSDTLLASPAPDVIEKLLEGGGGFTKPAQALKGLSAKQAIMVPERAPHSIAQTLGHMHFWQDWVLAAAHGQPRPFPHKAALGWPAVTEEDWNGLVQSFLAGLETCKALARDPESLGRPLNAGSTIGFGFDAHTVGFALAEVVALHNTHHLGQIILLRRLQGLWPPEGGGVTW